MSGHTPGKWLARPDPNGRPDDWCVGLDDDCSPVDYVATCHRHDARLIASAPDLLEALTEMLERYVSLVNSGDAGNWNPEDEPQVQQARAAIARATGAAP